MAHTAAVQTTAAGAFAYPAAASLTTPHHTVKLQFSLIHHIITSLILFNLKLIADHLILLLSLYHFDDGIWLRVIAHLVPNFEATVAKATISYVRPTVSQLFLIVLQFPTTVFPSVAIAQWTMEEAGEPREHPCRHINWPAGCQVGKKAFCLWCKAVSVVWDSF